jgi:hypothetical protein
MYVQAKMYAQATNVHALVRGLQDRTPQTSMRSCAVQNELRNSGLFQDKVKIFF